MDIGRIRMVFLIVTFIFTLPLVSGSVLPMQDLPSHEAVISIYSTLHSADANLFSKCFRTQSLFGPYKLYYIPGIMLHAVLNPDLYSRLFLIIIFWFYSWVLYRIARNNVTLFPVLALPYFYGIPYYSGMVNFLAGLPFFLILVVMLFQSEDRFDSPRWYIVLVLMQIITFFIHPVVYFLFTILVLIGLSERFVSGETIINPFVKGFLLPAIVGFGWTALFFHPESGGGDRVMTGLTPIHPGTLLATKLGIEWTPGQLRLNQVIDGILLPFGSAQQLLEAAMVFLIVMFLIYRFGKIRVQKNEPFFRMEKEFLTWFLFAGTAMMLPLSMKGVTYLSTRSISFIPPLFFVLLTPFFAGKRVERKRPIFAGNVITILCGIFILVTAANLVVQHRAFASEAEGGVRLTREVPRGASLLGLVVTGKSEWISTVLDPFIHIHQLHAVYSGGFVSTFPVQPLFPVLPLRNGCPDFPDRYMPGMFTWEKYGNNYDFILVKMSREHSGETIVGRRLARELIPHTRIVDSSGDWVLLTHGNK